MAAWHKNSKSVFLAVNASLRWLNNAVGVYLVQVSLLLIGLLASWPPCHIVNSTADAIWERVNPNPD